MWSGRFLNFDDEPIDEPRRFARGEEYDEQPMPGLDSEAVDAVREAVVNTVVHADYAQRGAPIRLTIFDDRLEVENPGLLFALSPVRLGEQFSSTDSWKGHRYQPRVPGGPLKGPTMSSVIQPP